MYIFLRHLQAMLMLDTFACFSLRQAASTISRKTYPKFGNLIDPNKSTYWKQERCAHTQDDEYAGVTMSLAKLPTYHQ